MVFSINWRMFGIIGNALFKFYPPTKNTDKNLLNLGSGALTLVNL